MKAKIQNLIHSQIFSNLIYFIILLNAILIGVETFYSTPLVSLVQNIILSIYVVELILRFIGRYSNQEYFEDNWNYFDIFVVVISFIPFAGSLAVLRSFRVIRVLRAVRAVPELRLISSVLLKSIRSLSYTGIFFGIFIYIYGVMGVMLFKFKDYAGSAYEAANNGYPDPYGSLSESYFTLFRLLTGEDWTDLRYILLKYSDYSSFTITTYHVSWMILSGFLLINLVVGAIINNYDQVMKEEKKKQEEDIQNSPNANRIK
ncbi:MAG: ion transporter [Sulfurimonas sp.]|nr:ion transporter [Sulfurimonas sp.]